MLFLERKKYIMPDDSRNTQYIREFNEKNQKEDGFFLGLNDWDAFTEYMAKIKPDELMVLEYYNKKES